MGEKCTDRVVGNILAGWRYDISGIAPEMRGDYEAHFLDCPRCRAKRRLHRTIDIGLIVVAGMSAVLFLVVFAAVRYFGPSYALLLEIAAAAGFVLSVLKKLPAEGEHFIEQGWRFEVIDMDGRKIDKLLVSALKPAAVVVAGGES